MKPIVPARLLWLFWILAVSVFVGIWLYPVSTGATRMAGVVMLGVVWLGLIVLSWRHRVFRRVVVGGTVLCAVVLALPGRPARDAAGLRASYVAGLSRYDGVPYYWGGESPKGVDCSGLIRRGLIDSLFLRGVRMFDPGLVRHAIWLWWHDCSARDLGEGHGMTTHLFDTPALNGFDHSRLLPGDLAVTRDGVHIMAYLGDRVWIEADPAVDKVITIQAPAEGNGWMMGPMRIVRWNVLAGSDERP